jgi:hypothetical protein
LRENAEKSNKTLVTIPLFVVLILSLTLTTAFAAKELIVNGGFEDEPITDAWSIMGHADELIFSIIPGEAQSGEVYLVMGGVGVDGTGKAHVEQTFSPPVYAHSDLTFWSRGEFEPTVIVVWIMYENVTIRHTIPVPDEWTKITVPIEKTKAIQSIRLSTYDEEDNIYTEWRRVDDISMLGGSFVIPEYHMALS